LYPDKLLFQVSKPARYTGGEWHAVRKDWDAKTLRFALGYPDLYEIGMSNLAIQILYELLNRRTDVLCERFFMPWTDMVATLRRASHPLRSLESGHPLGDFDVLGFSIGYELTFTNILAILDLAGLPVWARERAEKHPLVIAGGSAVFNPEPVADFIDLFVIGEAEEILPRLVDLIQAHKANGNLAKKELLRTAAELPGIYVPALYKVTETVVPTPLDGAPGVVRRQIVTSLLPSPVRPIVPYIETVHDRAAVEISRGCTRGCRFCSAGVIYRPVRERSPEETLAAVDEVLQNTGYDEVSLVSLSSGDYSGIDALLSEINRRHGSDIAVSLPSLRLDEHSVCLVDALPGRRKSALTFAPEAASPRLQRVINKYIPEDELLTAAGLAFARGWSGLKLYFMLGLPTETDDDASCIVDLARKVLATGQRASGRAPQLRLSLATFVPKAHTPFQWVSQAPEETLHARHEIIKRGLGRRVKLSYTDTRVSLLEAVMSRGDRRLGRVIHRAWQEGAVFDGWSECFDWERWQQAFTAEGLDPNFYARRSRALDEPLPWGHIDVGVSPGFLSSEYRRALVAELTPSCRTTDCNACGLEGWDVGCP